jgi:acetylornithine deacetylase/succinyl-diaminopimelate desuccinylase-like protein
LEGLDLIVEDAYPGCHWSVGQPGVQTLLNAYHSLGVTPQIWPGSPGAAPAYAFAEAGAPLVMGGLGHGGNAHSINEYATLEGMRRFARSLCLWLHAFRVPVNEGVFHG